LGAWSARRASLIGFAASAVLFVGTGGFVVSRVVALGTANAAVEHTLLARALAAELMSSLKDAETAQRGFVITGQTQYLQPYHEAETALPAKIGEFRRMTADNPAQQQNILAFEGVAARRMTILREGIASRQEYGFDAAAQVVASGEGMRLMNAARDVGAKMLAEEDRLWRVRGFGQRERANSVALAGLGGLAVAFALLLIAMIYILKSS
jgi:methyl-accepting chemotaxis protein